MILLLPMLACDRATIPFEPVFVRDGVLLPVGSGGVPVGGERELVSRAWAPGDRIGDAIAPHRPECVALFSVPLGDVSRAIAMGAEPPDTAIAFSPDGARLAIGAYTGEVVVADAWTGAELARRTIPEAVIKRVAWSADGTVLYAGEQSPDAYVRALDAATLADRWVFRTADDVGASTPPAGDDLYGVYQLPGVFGLEVAPDGDLVVAAVHGWVDGDVRRNASRLYELAPDGTVRNAFPATGAADATLLHPRYDPHGPLVVVPVGRSADGAPPADLPVDAVLALDAVTWERRGTFAADPLRPWFDRVFAWEAVDVSVADDLVVMGTGDGRVLAWRLSDGTPRATLSPGVPIDAGGVPIAASVGFATVAGGVVAVTSGTSIPYGAADPSLRPPSAHPNENALWAWTADGEPRWSWRGPHRLQGLTRSPDRATLVVGAGERETDRRTDLFGALVFRLDGDGTGEQRLVTTCPTAAPVFFRHAVADDGRIAVAEHPWRDGDVVAGAYRVTVLR